MRVASSSQASNRTADSVLHDSHCDTLEFHWTRFRVASSRHPREDPLAENGAVEFKLLVHAAVTLVAVSNSACQSPWDSKMTITFRTG